MQSDDPIYVMVEIEGKSQKMEIDSGSGISTMSLSKFQKSYPDIQLLENDIKLRSATGDVFTPHSYADVRVIHPDQAKTLRIYLIENDTFPTLLGRRWLKETDIDLDQLFRNGVHQIRVPKSSQNYKDRASQLLKNFRNLTKGGIGCIPNTESKLELTTKNPDPVYLTARPVPHSLIQTTDSELDHLEKHGVIKKRY